MQLIIKKIINTNFAVATDDGDSIFQLINSQFNLGKKVILNFEGITLITTTFLNAAIGQLYSTNAYSSDFLNKNLEFINIQDIDKHLFSMVVKTAKEYLADKEGFEKNLNDAIYGNYYYRNL